MWTTSPVVIQSLQLLFRVCFSLQNQRHLRFVSSNIGGIFSAIRLELDKRQKDANTLPLPKHVLSCCKHAITPSLQHAKSNKDVTHMQNALNLLGEVFFLFLSPKYLNPFSDKSSFIFTFLDSTIFSLEFNNKIWRGNSLSLPRFLFAVSLAANCRA
jgi:hypothetical protein